LDITPENITFRDYDGILLSLGVWNQTSVISFLENLMSSIKAFQCTNWSTSRNFNEVDTIEVLEEETFQKSKQIQNRFERVEFNFFEIQKIFPDAK
jgi:hypothetical protein